MVWGSRTNTPAISIIFFSPCRFVLDDRTIKILRSTFFTSVSGRPSISKSFPTTTTTTSQPFLTRGVCECAHDRSCVCVCVCSYIIYYSQKIICGRLVGRSLGRLDDDHWWWWSTKNKTEWETKSRETKMKWRYTNGEDIKKLSWFAVTLFVCLCDLYRV